MRAGIKGWKELCANIYKKRKEEKKEKRKTKKETLVLKCAESFEMLT